MKEIFLSRHAKRPRNKTGDKKGFFPKRPKSEVGEPSPQSRGMSHRTLGGFVMTNMYAPDDRKPLYHKWASEDNQGVRKRTSKARAKPATAMPSCHGTIEPCLPFVPSRHWVKPKLK